MSGTNYQAQVEGIAYQSANNYSVWCEYRTTTSIYIIKAYAYDTTYLSIKGY